MTTSALRLFVAIFGLSFGLSAAEPVPALDLAGAPVWTGAGATDLEQFAARELARYFRLICGADSPVRGLRVGETVPAAPAGPGVLIGTPAALSGLGLSVPADLSEEGYVLRVLHGTPPRLWVGGQTPEGVQRGAYALLERLGVGFYLGGDALPERRTRLEVPAELDVSRQPVFRIRGTLPWYNFLNSPTTWDLEDFQVFFDQMAKMGNNFVGFHSYDSEPFAAYPMDGAWRLGAPAATSLDYGWGAVRGLDCDRFGFGTGRYFPYAVFGSRSAAVPHGPPPAGSEPVLFPRRTPQDEAVLRAQAGLAQGLEYARRRGLHVCVGFELTGDPTVAENRRQAEARIRNLLATYPMIDHVWFWQSEGLGGGAATTAAPDSALDWMAQRWRSAFEFLGSPGRVGEAVRVAAWVQFAHGVVKRLRPDLKVIVSGWGGDAWMRFSDFYVGLDKVLAPGIVFAALDNIDPTAQTHVSEAYGRLSPGREKWPIPWFESDGGGSRRDQWFSQANVKPFTHLVRDAQAKGCQGLLAIHRQTRGVEEVAAYVAQFAWDPALTYEGFYAEFARKCFGEKHGAELAGILMRLEALGPRWTGASGQVECGGFQWFSDERRPQEANFKALAEVDAALERVAADCATGQAQRHLERLRYLRAGVAFALRFDRAALELNEGGRIANLVLAAERAKQSGNPAEAKRQAQAALEGLTGGPLGPAIEAYAARLSSQGDYGNLATINVKAYAAFLGLWERVQAASGETRALPGSAQRLDRPELVVKTPPTALPQGAPFTVRAVAFGNRPLRGVTLRHRDPGGPWQARPMRAAGRNRFEADIPGESIGAAGVEYCVVAEDEGGAAAVAPVGYPEAVFSASALPFPGPVVYGPWLHRGWAFASLPERGQDEPPGFLRGVAIPAGEYELCVWDVAVGATPRTVPGAYHLLAVPARTGPAELTVPPWQVRDPRGNARRSSGVTFAPPPAPPAPGGVTAELVEPFHVRLAWTNPPAAEFEIHRSPAPGFVPDASTLVARWPWRVYEDDVPGPGASYEYAVVAVGDSGARSVPARSPVLHVEDAPLPPAPARLAAVPGLGRITLRWEPSSGATRGYVVYGADGGTEHRLSGVTPIRATEFVVATEDPTPRHYTVRGIDRAKRLGPAAAAVAAAPLPVPREPVFVADFAAVTAATGQRGTLAGGAAVGESCLDVRSGGWIAYPGEELLQVGAPLTVALWVNVDRIEGIPVLISFGHWEGPGWWLQLIGGQIRFYLPVQKILDAGSLPTGGWHHLAATYDGSISRLFVDGREVGQREVGPVDPTPWGGELRIGMYSDAAAQYQTLGRIDAVRIWRRALSADEVRGVQRSGR